MTVTKVAAMLALGALACGGGEKQQAQPETPAQDQAAATAGPVVEVQMTGTGSTAAFEPAALTIAPGTTIRFINASGGPHNVAFWGDSIPAGAGAALNAAMAGRTMGDLSGMMVTQPNETFDVSFAGAPTGLYKGYCLPHQAMGMKIDITVQ